MERTDEPNELSDAPTLRNLSRNDPFVVPEGFFDAFPHAVQQHALAGTKTPSRLASGWQRMLRPAFAIASITILATAALLWMERPRTIPAEQNVAWSADELLDADMDVEVLYTEYPVDGDLMDAVHLPQDDEAVLAYLDNEDLPLDLLIEEL